MRICGRGAQRRFLERLIAVGAARIAWTLEFGELARAADASAYNRFDVPPAVLWHRHLEMLLREAGVTDNDAVVLAAAGSSDPSAAQNVEELTDQLRALRSNRIVAAYGASAKPSVPDAVAMLREEAAGGAGAGESAGAVDLGGRVVIASYLLAPGFFHDQLAKAGADLVTAPLLPSPVLAEIALERYDAALAGARQPRP